MAFPWISVGGNGGIGRNHGREIQLNRREMAFSWISVGGNDVMRRNGEREIHLERRVMAFLRISVGGNGGMRRNLGTIRPFHPELYSISIVSENRFRVKPG